MKRSQKGFNFCAMWDMDLPSQGPTLFPSGSVWNLQENKAFENALAKYDKDTPDRWEKVAAMVPGKSAMDVRKHYKDLEDDVKDIEAGLVDVSYNNSSYTIEWIPDKAGQFPGLKQSFGSSGKGPPAKSSEQERKKGIPWTEEEHRLFLMGLSKYGKGDWRSISRNYVVTRTPTQVASHAQKYFIRLSSGNKDKRRASIHDITSVSGTDRRSFPLPQSSAICGQNNSTSIPAELSQSALLMYPSPMARVPFPNGIGTQADRNHLMLPQYPLSMYSQMGLGGHSSITIIPDSIVVTQMGYPRQHAMQY
ncbi:hypothetical protein SUGI_0861100 [Cryptomeria japonica]|nr:hypothetical protein SUGI_0861100 [Cryptomeria japonica]